MFDSKKSLRIETDTSDHIITEVVMQENQPIEFILHKMNQTEQNYIITEKEILMMIQAVKEWGQYLKENDQSNVVIMNHKNLIYFRNVRIINRRQIR